MMEDDRETGRGGERDGGVGERLHRWRERVKRGEERIFTPCHV